jgi:hypothetical protein
MTPGPALPRVHALIVCDELEPEEEDRVFNLAGVRTEIRALHFPYRCPQFCVYLQVAAHHGTAPCHLVVVDAGNNVEVLSVPELLVNFEGPLTIIPLWWRIRDCWFPHPGLYYVQVYFGSRLANERLLVLSQNGVSSNGQQ